jgi:hypothetical protein
MAKNHGTFGIETHTDLGGTRAILLLDFTKYKGFRNLVFFRATIGLVLVVENGKVEISPPKRMWEISDSTNAGEDFTASENDNR